ncbi:hypothetical protein AB0A91_16380 [Streptomyces sp. NPDC042207]|uniref:hypothetical protein n=1 Tax=Streptomyces sp. NPDC042207 TaxID=3154331 RepID=UPI0033D3E777
MARRFVSKAQWRAMFARRMPWARKWAHRNQRSRPYKTLPRHSATSGRRGRRRR